MDIIKIGTAGAGDLFYSKGFKNSENVPEFLASIGLNSFEYQCGRGVRLGDEKAKLLGENATKHSVALSIHAPYYISLSTTDSEKRENNFRYLKETAHIAKIMKASRIVFHPGSVNKSTNRKNAFEIAYDALSEIMNRLNNEGYSGILFCPETMGKINQLGDLDETLRFCKISDNMIPCIDFGHLNSRLQGALKSTIDFENIFHKISEELGENKTKMVHCHFSKIEYGKGGEKKHLTFTDNQFGPEFEPLIEVLIKKKYTPTIICESAGTQAEDAKAMLDYYNKKLK